MKVYVVQGFTGDKDTYVEWPVLAFTDLELAKMFVDEMFDVYEEFPDKIPRHKYEKAVLYEAMQDYDPLFNEKEKGVGYFINGVELVEFKTDDV